MSEFVHLRAHSARSVEDGIIEPESLVALAAEAGQPAVALTDLNRMFGVVPFYKAARQAGVKPIVGADMWLESDVTQPGAPPTRLLLLCQNQAGYRTLMRWMSQAYLNTHIQGKACLKQSWFQKEGTEGLIALSGDSTSGEVARLLLADLTPSVEAPGAPELLSADQGRQAAAHTVAFYKKVFGDRYYLEVQRAAQPHEYESVARTVALADATDTPLVATHPIVFAQRGDYFAHEVRTCIDSGQQAEDPGRVSRFTREQNFKTSEEMAAMFQDLPEAIANAGEVAKRCSTTIELGKNHLPDFPTPDGSAQNDHFETLSREGLDRRLVENYPDPDERARLRPPFEERLTREIETIKQMGFAGYFLIVSDFINWSKNNDIPVGPGRGSGAGSLVAYALRITDLEPTHYDLLFERFLNPERVSMPDFDIDFEIKGRNSVIDYVRQKYGARSVSQIATFNTLAARAAIKDVARALGYKPYFAQMLSDLVPKVIGITLDDALVKSPKLKEKYERDRGVRRVVDMARKLEGLPRTIGTHAGGVVISPGEIWNYSPLYVAEDGGGVVCQYDKDDVEKAGLVKFDFLGLSNLTVIQKALRFINNRAEFKGKPFTIEGLKFDAPEVYSLLQDGDTVGIFQLESEGITKVCTQLKPDCFEDVIALLALYRPGPLNSGMVSDFIKRKHGEAEVTYPHPLLEPILRPTYGVMVYQEQVMQTAQVMAGYTLGGADLLRRAMGKKKPEEMAKERAKFESGCVARGIDAAQAVYVFDLMEKFAEYGFNKSHSAAYAMISYQTAWLKAMYPAEYYSAFMNVESDDKDKVALLTKSARARGMTLLPPDVNQGMADFQPVGDRALRYGLAGLKGVGEASIRAICEAREREGAFTSLFDFCKKVGRSVATKTVVEALARSGAFDSLHPNRATVMASVKDGLDYAGKLAKKSKEEGLLLPELLAEGEAPAAVAPKRRKKTTVIVEPMMTEAPEWTLIERMDEEKRAVGFYLSGHPFEGYAAQFGGLKAAISLKAVNEIDPVQEGESLKLVAGVVSRVKEYTPASGAKMAFLSIDDGVVERDLTLFSSSWEEHSAWIKPGVFLACSATIRADRRGGDHGNELTGEDVYAYDRLQQVLAQKIDVVVDRKELGRLQDLIEKHRMPEGAALPDGGMGIPLVLHMPDGDDSYFRTELPEVRLKPSQDLLSDFHQSFGTTHVKLTYAVDVSLKPKPRKPRPRR